MAKTDYNYLVAGVDEAGRGPLAGDVYAAAVILPPAYHLPNLKDSKKLSAKAREILYPEICRQALSYAVSYATVAEIEQLNILQATLLAMRRAIFLLTPSPATVLIDGKQIPKELPVTAQAVIRGDDKIPAIAAASVLAKVSRDREMDRLDRLYPGYGFARHKGYGTKSHLEAIRTLGITAAHRRTFAPVKLWLNRAAGEIFPNPDCNTS